MKKRVVLLRSNPVSPDPPVEKVTDTLISRGYEITIVGWDRDSSIPERVEELQLEQGMVKIIRLGIPGIYNGGIRKNFLPLAKFQIKLYKWLKKHKGEYDIIHSFDFDTGFVADKIARKYSKALIYHILDFYIDSHNIPNKYLKSKVRKKEISIINNANATVICTEKRIQQIAGATPKYLEIIHNTPKALSYVSDSFCEINKSDRYKIVYVGILTGSRFLREIIKFVEQDERFEFHVGGFGTLGKEIEEISEKCNRIIYYGKLPYDKTLALEQSCDIMIAIYNPQIPNHRYAAPNKFYEALMLGKPIIMARNTGFDEIIENNDIGCLIEFNERSLSQGLNYLIEKRSEWDFMSERMREIYKVNYSWSEMEKRILNLYTNL